MEELVFGNPWIFEKIIHYLLTGQKLKERTPAQKLEIIKKHLYLELESKPEIVVIKEFRKHVSAYTKSLPNSSEFRNKINMIDNKEELERELNEFYRKCN